MLDRADEVIERFTRRRGESGESGENPHQQRDSGRRKNGEAWRKSGEEDLAAALRAAADLLAGSHRSIEYPADALGPLAEACTAISEAGQLSPAMAGQSLLATAALLVQGVADVRTLAGIKPLAIYALTVADSGDGKSTAESVTLAAVRDRQRLDSDAYRRATANSDAEPPRAPYRVMRDGTVEGIRTSFKAGMPAQGVFTAEAAVMLSGYGMSPDNKAKTAATFNGLWDDGELSVSRSGAGRVQLYDRRLSAHWQIQPDAARAALADPLLSGIGFWPRFIVAWPEPAPPRKARPFDAGRDHRIVAYWQRCTELLDQPVGESCADLPIIEPTSEAAALAGKFFERMEHHAKAAGGELVTVKPFALRATEHLFRVAGVLAAFADQFQIDAAAMRNAARLVSFSLETWRTIFGDREESDARRKALALFEWLLKQPNQAATETAILRIAPRTLRSKSARDTALALLEHHQLVSLVGKAWVVRT